MQYENFTETRDQVQKYWKGIGFAKFKKWYGFPFHYFCSSTKSGRMKKETFDEIHQVIRVAKALWDKLPKAEQDKRSYMRLLKQEFTQFVKANGFHYKGYYFNRKDECFDEVADMAYEEPGFKKVELIDYIKSEFKRRGYSSDDIINCEKKRFYKNFHNGKYIEVCVSELKQKLMECQEYGISFA